MGWTDTMPVYPWGRHNADAVHLLALRWELYTEPFGAAYTIKVR